MAVSILIYEDNDLLRESLSGMIAQNHSLHLIGEFGQVLNIEEQVKQHMPELILMDIDMPGMTGIEAVKKVRVFNSEVYILMLTVFDDNQHVFDAICTGASGYLLKKHISTKLFSAIEEALEGGAPMSPSIARMVLTSFKKNSEAENPYQLTPKEKEVLTSLSKGNSYKL